MSNENQPAAGSRMKQPGQDQPTGQAIPGVTEPAAKPIVRRNTAGKTAAAAGIDYERLAGMIGNIVDSKIAIIMKSKGTETDRHEIGQPSDIMLKDGTLATGGADIAAIDAPLESDYFKDLAFMEEEIMVTVSETDDANAENPVIVGNGGIFKVFFRGHPTVAKRKFVDCLIVKSTRVTTPEYTNGAGERANKINQHNAHKYPFTVNEDRNPKGGAWLRRRLAEVI
jgi:hypothetical protein